MSFQQETNFAVKELAGENGKNEFLTACDVLLKFATNILGNPQEPKFRRIRISNEHVQGKLLVVPGGMDCLFAMGFIEAEDREYLVLPASADLQQIEKMKNDLLIEKGKVLGTHQPQVAQNSSRSNATRLQVPSRLTGAPNIRMAASAYAASEHEFLGRIKSSMTRVMNYESSAAQTRARGVIPLDQLSTEAKTMVANTKSSESAVSTAMDYRDCLLLALLRWFKQDFFSWVDTLPCELCGGPTQHNGSLTPSADDLRWGGSRVEAHFCSICSHATRFTRFTNAIKLLETRRGRCGEWADCFTLCCRAMDFEARYVLDWTDHVWTEVFSISQQRWLHCDPCENVCDKPLLYESGWGKKLSYVIAFSKDEVQDVSWRYSAKHIELLSRRNACRESWLRRTVHSMWKAKLSQLTDERKKVLWTRLIHELTEFLSVKSENGEYLPGRTTGSLAWRLARGEVGDDNTDENNKFIFSVTEKEKQAMMVHLCYSCVDDKYVRKSDNGSSFSGWQTCTYSVKNIARKEERDWKMVYLARKASSNAEIVWKFDATGSGLTFKKLNILASSAVFENAKISWRICAGDEQCFIKSGADLKEFQAFDLEGNTTLTITASLTGGKGDVAWQHTQLFRQSMDARPEPLFEIQILLQ